MTISRRGLLFAGAASGAALALAPLPARAGERRPPGEAGERLPHDLGSLAGAGAASEATGLNDRGDVVGATALPGGTLSHAFVMNPRVNGGRLRDLTPSLERDSRAQAVNRYGVVAGTIGMGVTPSAAAVATAALRTAPPERAAHRLAGARPPLPFVWHPRTGLEVLPPPPGAYGGQVSDIDDRGTVLVVGTNDVPDPNVPGANYPVGSFLWDPARRAYTALTVPDPSVPGIVALANRLTGCGGVAGGVIHPLEGGAWQHTAVVWGADRLRPRALATGGYTDAFATAGNSFGLLTGWRMNAPGGMSNAVYWPHPAADPVELGGRVAFGVNERGQIAGVRDLPGSPGFPFASVVWEPARGRTTPLGDFGQGSYVYAVDAAGRSAGFAVAKGGAPHNTGVWWEAVGR
ncbi:hypothetical protein [Streptomyces sp. NPDC091383]|uniref:hypothetical protein n=1 Tax=Streptomyces sp. NPDC091383 TaxID=3365996 RepID=UPI003810E2A3